MKSFLRTICFLLLILIGLNKRGEAQCTKAKYASLPYTQDFENWINLCDSLDAPDSSWSNTPLFGDNSIRRDDQGGAGQWDAPNSNGYIPTSFHGSHSARFHAWFYGTDTAKFDL